MGGGGLKKHNTVFHEKGSFLLKVTQQYKSQISNKKKYRRTWKNMEYSPSLTNKIKSFDLFFKIFKKDENFLSLRVGTGT